VVTEFVLRLHPQRETVFGGTVVFPGSPELVESIFNSTAEWMKTMSPKDELILTLADPPDQPVFGSHFATGTVFIIRSSSW
jgi:hypothetical protein